MNDNKIKDMTLNAMFMALVIIGTLVIKIPTVTGGNINLGDTVIFIAAFLLGGLRGGIAGGIGASLADLLGGHYSFVFATLFIKFAEGLVAGFVFSEIKNKTAASFSASAVGGAVMVFGYFIYEYFALSPGIALSVFVPNILQAVICAALTVIIYPLAVGGKKKKIR